MPNANWNSDKFKVNWNNPSNANDNLRSRQKFPTRIKPELVRALSINKLLAKIFYPAIGHFGDFLQTQFYANIFFAFYDF